MARVTGVNSLSSGFTSLTSTSIVMVRVLPYKPSVVPQRGSTTSPSQIEVDWSLLLPPTNGDSDILSYNLQWDAGTGGSVNINVVGYSVPYMQSSYVITSGVTAG